MANQLPPMLKHYDRLAAVAVLAALLVSLIFLVVKGVELQQEVNEYDGVLEAGQPSKSQLTPAENATDLALVSAVAKPEAARFLPVTADPAMANLATVERRLLCVNCTKPIAWGVEKCPFCNGNQPKEEKIDLAAVDSDGDGIPDVEELKLKLNPQDGTDVDLDADKDGFTNIEEYLAKTDMNDPKSHPGYETRIVLEGIEGTKLNFRATNKMALPSIIVNGKSEPQMSVTFVPVEENGELGTAQVRVKNGQEIGKTGFVFVRYTEKSEILRGEKGEMITSVNVSVIDLKRVADGKEIATVFFDPKNPKWPGDPLIEQRATLKFDVPNVKPVVVAPGGTFAVKGEKYTVLDVDAEKKTVRIRKNATNKEFNLK